MIEYESLEKKFLVLYPNSNQATYKTLMNFSDDLGRPYQRWYRYKEGFSIELVKQIILEFSNKKGGKILDPFVGSGSTLIGANDLGMIGIGFEVNPFAYFLAKTKLNNYSEYDILNFKIAQKKILKKNITKSEVYNLPLLSFSNNVFQYNIEQYFMTIKQRIDKYENENVKNLLMLGWLSCLENISNYKKAGNGLKKRNYVHPRVFNEFDIYNLLNSQYQKMTEDLEQKKIKFDVKIYNESSIYLNKFIQNESIQGVIFSPPYANCFDYTEIYKLELWFGNFVSQYSDLKILRNKSIRSHLNGNFKDEISNIKTTEFLDNIILEIENKKLWDKKIPIMLRLYFTDMFKILDQSYSVLENKGFCAIVIGNSSYGGTIIPTDLILSEYAAKIGFTVERIEIGRYLITSSQQYHLTIENKKYLRESIICLTKK